MPKLNSDAVVRHFAALASAVEIEIVVQDYPPACGFAMEPALLARNASLLSQNEQGPRLRDTLCRKLRCNHPNLRIGHHLPLFIRLSHDAI